MHHLTFYYFPHIFFKNSVLPCFTGKKVLPVVIPVNHWFGKTSKTTTLVMNTNYFKRYQRLIATLFRTVLTHYLWLCANHSWAKTFFVLWGENWERTRRTPSLYLFLFYRMAWTSQKIGKKCGLARTERRCRTETTIQERRKGVAELKFATEDFFSWEY